MEDKDDPLVASLQALFDVIAEAAEKGPLIVFVQVPPRARVAVGGCRPRGVRTLSAQLATWPAHLLRALMTACLPAAPALARSRRFPRQSQHAAFPPLRRLLFAPLWQNLDRLLRTHAVDHFRKLDALLAGLAPRCLLFAGYCSRSLARAEAKREGGPPSFSRIFLGGGEGKPWGGAEARMRCAAVPAQPRPVASSPML